MRAQWRVTSSVLGLTALLACAVPAHATLLPFNGITGNNPVDIAIGEAQLRWDVADDGAGLALFTVVNKGPEASAIASVYFDGDILAGIDAILDSPPDVDFEVDGAPPDLPGGNMVGFMADHRASAVAPPPMMGINPSEGLQIRVSYTGSFTDLVDSLLDGSLRLGIHAIAFASGGSESFVNKPVPGPAGLPLLALAALAGRGRRRR